ncbi:amphiphysin [Latimeria chalumnae]|uniref:amphiphysin n=1 Tax=Latimeria chalumnae TaxID=7897 RepID=UPI00313F3CFD
MPLNSMKHELVPLGFKWIKDNIAYLGLLINAHTTQIEEEKEELFNLGTRIYSLTEEDSVQITKMVVKQLHAFKEANEPDVNEPTLSADTESRENIISGSEVDSTKWPTEDTEPSQVEEIINVPSVVIEPASNNEEEEENFKSDDVNGVKDLQEATSMESNNGEAPTVPSTQEEVQETDNIPSGTGATQNQPAAETDSSTSVRPLPGLLFKVEMLHDFEAANPDELNLKRGDIVLVIASELQEDQDAGWLTGVKETDWIQHGEVNTYKGLFPQSFSKRLE